MQDKEATTEDNVFCQTYISNPQKRLMIYTMFGGSKRLLHIHLNYQLKAVGMDIISTATIQGGASS